jgi:hypothetical protein
LYREYARQELLQEQNADRTGTLSITLFEGIVRGSD